MRHYNARHRTHRQERLDAIERVFIEDARDADEHCIWCGAPIATEEEHCPYCSTECAVRAMVEGA